MYDVTITMVTGKIFRFQTDDAQKPNEYMFRHENGQLFCITDNGVDIYMNPMQIAYAEFKKVSE